jgi:hypothetical protein
VQRADQRCVMRSVSSLGFNRRTRELTAAVAGLTATDPSLVEAAARRLAKLLTALCDSSSVRSLPPLPNAVSRWLGFAAALTLVTLGASIAGLGPLCARVGVTTQLCGCSVCVCVAPPGKPTSSLRTLPGAHSEREAFLAGVLWAVGAGGVGFRRSRGPSGGGTGSSHRAQRKHSPPPPTHPCRRCCRAARVLQVSGLSPLPLTSHPLPGPRVAQPGRWAHAARRRQTAFFRLTHPVKGSHLTAHRGKTFTAATAETEASAACYLAGAQAYGRRWRYTRRRCMRWRRCFQWASPRLPALRSARPLTSPPRVSLQHSFVRSP